MFAGEGPRCIVDQLARDPDSLANTFAACLRTLHNPKLVLAFDVILVIGPEHARVFAEAGWDRERLLDELHARLQIPGSELVRGADGIAEGVPEHLRELTLGKFRPGGILIVHAGGGAGLFSAMIGGWANGDIGSKPVTRLVGALGPAPTRVAGTLDRLRTRRPCWRECRLLACTATRLELDSAIVGRRLATQMPDGRRPRAIVGRSRRRTPTTGSGSTGTDLVVHGRLGVSWVGGAGHRRCERRLPRPAKDATSRSTYRSRCRTVSRPRSIDIDLDALLDHAATDLWESVDDVNLQLAASPSRRPRVAMIGAASIVVISVVAAAFLVTRERSPRSAEHPPSTLTPGQFVADVVEAANDVGWDLTATEDLIGTSVEPGAVVTGEFSPPTTPFGYVADFRADGGRLLVALTYGVDESSVLTVRASGALRTDGTATVYLGRDSDMARYVELFDNSKVVLIQSSSSSGAAPVDGNSDRVPRHGMLHVRAAPAREPRSDSVDQAMIDASRHTERVRSSASLRRHRRWHVDRRVTTAQGAPWPMSRTRVGSAPIVSHESRGR